MSARQRVKDAVEELHNAIIDLEDEVAADEALFLRELRRELLMLSEVISLRIEHDEEGS